jgi:hypothetical protein
LPAENHTVNASFNITTENTPVAKQNLFVQAGRQGISFIQLDGETNTFTLVQVYHFAKHLTDANIAEEINAIVSAKNLQHHHFKKIHLNWCFNESILVPHEYFDATKAANMIELVYGDAMPGTVQNELVTSHNLHLLYKIPALVKTVFANWAPFCIQTHQNSVVLNFYKENKDLLYCHFYTEHLTILLRKKGQLQIIQNFDFTTPEDVAYQLLNVCRSFEVAANAATLVVSGMIDTNSNLYNELYKYFLKIDFAALPVNFNYTSKIKEHPAHYFSHLFATAACVL